MGRIASGVPIARLADWGVDTGLRAAGGRDQRDHGGHAPQLGPAWRVHAYGSVFHTLAGFVAVVFLAAMIMLALTVFWTAIGAYTVARHAPVANVVRFWTAMVAVWVIGFGTIYLGPYLT